MMSDSASGPSSSHSKRDQSGKFAPREPVNPGDPPKRVHRKKKDVAPSSSSASSGKKRVLPSSSVSVPGSDSDRDLSPSSFCDKMLEQSFRRALPDGQPPSSARTGRKKTSAPRQSAPRVTAPRDAAPRESAPRGSAPRETAPRETTPRVCPVWRTCPVWTSAPQQIRMWMLLWIRAAS